MRNFMPLQQHRMFSFSWPCPRLLREIVKMSAFEKETADNCEMIWNEYHHAKPHTVSTVLTSKQYAELTSKGKNSPVFIFPVPKGEPPAHFVLVSQFQERAFLLTFLGDYQKNPQGAHPYMVVTCFEELQATKDIVLLRGDLISNLDEDEGKTLLTRLIESYMYESQYDTVHKFNNEPMKFNYEEYIRNELGRFNSLKKHLIETKSEKLDMTVRRKKDYSDAEMNIFKGGIIR